MLLNVPWPMLLFLTTEATTFGTMGQNCFWSCNLIFILFWIRWPYLVPFPCLFPSWKKEEASKVCRMLKSYFLDTVTYEPSLNTQSCNRRPLCSTFRFENMRISPKKTVFFTFLGSENFKKKIVKKVLCNFSVRTL